MARRSIEVRVADTSGCVATGRWPVADGLADSHADAISIGLALYEQVRPEADPTSLQITTTWYRVGQVEKKGDEAK